VSLEINGNIKINSKIVSGMVTLELIQKLSLICVILQFFGQNLSPIILGDNKIIRLAFFDFKCDLSCKYFYLQVTEASYSNGGDITILDTDEENPNESSVPKPMVDNFKLK